MSRMKKEKAAKPAKLAKCYSLDDRIKKEMLLKQVEKKIKKEEANKKEKKLRDRIADNIGYYIDHFIRRPMLELDPVHQIKPTKKILRTINGTLGVLKEARKKKLGELEAKLEAMNLAKHILNQPKQPSSRGLGAVFSKQKKYKQLSSSRLEEEILRLMEEKEKTRKKKFYLANFHNHFDLAPWGGRGYGEALNTPPEMFGRAITLDFDVFGTTTHYRAFEVKKTLNYLNKLNDEMEYYCKKIKCDYKRIILLVGTEYKTRSTWKKKSGYKSGHWGVFFAPVTMENADYIEEFTSNMKKDKLSAEDLLMYRDCFNAGKPIPYKEKLSAKLHGVDMAIIPFHWGIKQGIGRKSVERLVENNVQIDGLEVINTGSTFQGWDYKKKRWKYVKELDCAEIGSSDAHRVGQFGPGYTIIKASNLETDVDVIEAIKNKQTKAAYVPMSKFKNQLIDKAKMYHPYYLTKLMLVFKNQHLFIV